MTSPDGARYFVKAIEQMTHQQARRAGVYSKFYLFFFYFFHPKPITKHQPCEVIESTDTVCVFFLQFNYLINDSANRNLLLLNGKNRFCLLYLSFLILPGNFFL